MEDDDRHQELPSPRVLEVSDRVLEHVYSIAELAEAEIAVAAEKPAHPTRRMVVIYDERPPEHLSMPVADRAATFLLLEQSVVLGRREAVPPFDPRWVGRVTTAIAYPHRAWRVDDDEKVASASLNEGAVIGLSHSWYESVGLSASETVARVPSSNSSRTLAKTTTVPTAAGIRGS